MLVICSSNRSSHTRLPWHLIAAIYCFTRASSLTITFIININVMKQSPLPEID